MSEIDRNNPDLNAVTAALREVRPDPSDPTATSAWMLGVLGVLHSPVYRSKELRSRLAEDGIADPMGAYLAQRAAPLGRASAELVAATFYGFSPAIVAEHIPGVWRSAEPERVVARTFEAMRELYARLFEGRTDELALLHQELRPVVAATTVAGRPLAAAWSSIPATGDPLVDLWLATCVIRESRGDGHIALLVAEGIGPLESHLMTQGDVPERRPFLLAERGWSEDAIAAAAAGLRERGLLDAEGRRTDAGRALRDSIEDRTNLLSAAPWAAVSAPAVQRIGDLALGLIPAILASGSLKPRVIERLLQMVPSN